MCRSHLQTRDRKKPFAEQPKEVFIALALRDFTISSGSKVLKGNVLFDGFLFYFECLHSVISPWELKLPRIRYFFIRSRRIDFVRANLITVHSIGGGVCVREVPPLWVVGNLESSKLELDLALDFELKFELDFELDYYKNTKTKYFVIFESAL